MDFTFNETLVGEAAQVCMRMNFQPALYVNYILKMCKTNVNDLVKSAVRVCLTMLQQIFAIV